ncbi:hydroxyisourate hydrolase [Bradymonas sediminis]|uniref:5-hydroxyisourate hydrolase n=1 Tax=Bradymonas sediminis TaxID=1548548 RepID=A0A2Z4FPM5_9DELT|nr:hydroxyisourate hydrolase [Bradymonas sediminis]AWV90949.1 hydroxyisourate hydrolase [Bradymonas sediminis]TDP75314.1 5-hydroxyisourate hydrolase [Bradymonas sediminis]
MSTISTHILDTSRGCPAEGVPLILEARTHGGWRAIGGGTTNADGRVVDLLNEGESLLLGMYRMSFETAVYFEEQAVKSFYPVVRVVFEVDDADSHYHVPLLLSPFGYSTYRGS